jgi:hypothetical protein
MENIFFTIVDADTNEETQLHFEYEDVGGYEGVPATPVKMIVGPVPLIAKPIAVRIEPQQLAELGALFLALAGTDVDYSGADALLEGFNLKGKEAAQKLASELEE